MDCSLRYGLQVGSLVIVVEDEPDLRALAERWLIKDGYEVESAPDAEQALEVLTRTLPSAVCLDLELPGLGGLEALKQIKKTHPKLPVIILTANDQVETAVAAMQSGAYDYLVKPVDRTKLATTVRNAIEAHDLMVRVDHLEREADGGGYADILGESTAMKRAFREVDRVAMSDVTVLVHGESGTGKELVARAIHEHSGRSRAPFVAVNCAAIPETLQESELFGHERGAFTSANQRRIGYFEQADRGVLFLDEIGELSPAAQAKLLRVLQQRVFRRVGGQSDVRSDFRLVAATHRDLREEVTAGRFREDLYFRIAVFELELPPLRDRHGDVALLARSFLRQFAPDRPVTLAPTALAALESHSWPGNVRELMNAMQRALVVCGEVVELEDLPKRLRDHKRDTPIPTSEPVSAGEGEQDGLTRMEALERAALVTALEETGGNISGVVRRLGLGRTTVYRKLKKYGLR